MSDQRERFPDHVRAFSELLIRLRSELGNDLDMVLIMAVIAERHYASLDVAAGRDEVGADPALASESFGINALSVALYADIPRETVRRKIARLVKKGWIDCDARGSLSPTAQAARDLAGGTDATLTYMHTVMREGQF